MADLDEPVTVELSDGGDPVAFIWDRFEYTVVGQPQVVFTRTRWWETEAVPDHIDTEMWRLDAVRGDGEQRRYELARRGDGWRLVADLG